MLFRQWVPFTLEVSFTLLTCPSLCALQGVCAHQFLTYFHCPHLSLLHNSGSECPPLACLLLLSWPISSFMLFSWWVTLACSFYLFQCHDPSLFPHSLGSECPLLFHFLSFSWLVPPSALFRMWVPFACSLFLVSWFVPLSLLFRKWVYLPSSFYWLDLCCLQTVNAHHLLLHSDLHLPLHSSVCVWPSFTCFL